MDKPAIKKRVDKEVVRLTNWYGQWPTPDRHQYFVEKSEKEFTEYLQDPLDTLRYRSGVLRWDYSLRSACENLSSWHLFRYEAIALSQGKLDLNHFSLSARYGEWAVRFAEVGVSYGIAAVGMNPERTIPHLAMSIVLGWRAETEQLWQIFRIGLDTALLNAKIGNDRAKATDCYRHFWFILRLYADYKGRTIDTNPYYYPSDMTPFVDVLANWRTIDQAKVTTMVLAMADFHVQESKDEAGGKDFEFSDWQYRLPPMEIMAFLCLRQWAGLGSPDEYDHPLMQQPLAKVPNEVSVPDTPLLNQVIAKFKKEYPAVFAKD